MARVSQLVVDLDARTAKMEKGLKRAQGDLEKFRATSGRARVGVRQFGTGVRSAGGQLAGFGKAFVPLLAAGGIAAFAKGALDAGDKLQKMAIQTGISVEALSQLEFVADRQGVSFDTLSKGVETLGRRTSEAAKGMKAQSEAIEALGLDTEHLLSLSPEDRFEVVADALEGVTDQATKTRLSYELMGRAGNELLKVTSVGSEGIRALRDEADALGKTMSTDAANAAAAAKDSFANLSAASDALTNTFLTTLGPSIAQAVQFLADHLPTAVRGSIDSINNFRESLSEYLFPVLDVVIPIIGGVVDAFKTFGRVVLAVVDSVTGAFSGLGASVSGALDSVTNTVNAVTGKFAEMRDQAGAITEGLRDRVSGAFEDLYTTVVGNSIVPDMVVGVLQQFDLMRSGSVSKAVATTDGVASALGDMGAKTDGVFADMSGHVDGFFGALKSSIDGGKVQWQDFAKVAIDAIASVVSQQAQAGAAGGAGGGGFGGIFGSLLGGLTGLFKADGGPVSANKPYIVGERGPELFMPRQSGTVVPNGAVGGSTQNVTINAPITVRTDGAPVDKRSLTQIRAAALSGTQAALSRLR